LSFKPLTEYLIDDSLFQTSYLRQFSFYLLLLSLKLNIVTVKN